MTTSPVVRKWFPGMIASITPYTLRSNIPEVLAKDVFCSTPCIYEDDASNSLTKCHTVVAADAANTNIAGFAIRNDQIIYTQAIAALNILQYPDDSIVTLLSIGDIAVYAETAVKPGDDVYFRVTVDGGFTNLHTYSNAAGTGLVPIVGAKFVERTTGAGTTVINVSSTCHIGT